MASTPTFEEFLLDAYLKNASPEDILALVKANFARENGLSDEFYSLFENFFSKYGEDYSVTVIELLLDDGDKSLFGTALRIVQSAPAPPQITERVLVRLVGIDDDREFMNFAEPFFFYGGPADEDNWSVMLPKHYAAFPVIRTIVRRFERIKARNP